MVIGRSHILAKAAAQKISICMLKLQYSPISPGSEAIAITFSSHSPRIHSPHRLQIAQIINNASTTILNEYKYFMGMKASCENKMHTLSFVMTSKVIQKGQTKEKQTLKEMALTIINWQNMMKIFEYNYTGEFSLGLRHQPLGSLPSKHQLNWLRTPLIKNLLLASQRS